MPKLGKEKQFTQITFLDFILYLKKLLLIYMAVIKNIILKGGDILNINETLLFIGISQRTTF